jgi:hypothetical protein
LRLTKCHGQPIVDLDVANLKHKKGQLRSAEFIQIDVKWRRKAIK